MTGTRASRITLLVLVAPLVFALVAPSSEASAATAGSLTARPGRALIFVVDGVSVPEALTVPAFRQLARAGGLGLMTTHVHTVLVGRRRSSYLTIGAGTPLSDPLSGDVSLMAKTLGAAGVQTCSVPESTPLSDIGDGACQATNVKATVRVIRLREPSGSAAARHSILRADGRVVRAEIQKLNNARALVAVVVPMPSVAMDAQGDEVTPLIEAQGTASELLPANGLMHGLTSASTRQDGLVANTDLAPTVVGFFDVAVPADMDGNPMRFTPNAPLKLYDRQVKYRRIRFPVQLVELAFVVLAGLAAIRGLLWLDPRRRLSPRTARVWTFLALMGLAFPVTVLAGGLIPWLTYGVVIPYLFVVPALLAWLALRVRWPGPYPAFGFVGAVGLAFIVLDLLTGTHALRLPLEGGVMFDGVRFYGLPNFGFSPLLASALFVAVGLSTGWGTALLVATGLIDGWPRFGADVGGSIALFVAAGLWFAVRRAGGKLRPSGVGIAAGFTAVGLAVVLFANRFLAGTPTHATRFVQRTGNRFVAVLRTVGDRLDVGLRLMARDPAVLLPLIGLLVILVLVVRRPGTLRAGLADKRWRNMVGVLVGAALVSYFVNDTGSTAAAPAFLYAMVAILLPTVEAYTADPATLPRSAGSSKAPAAKAGATAGAAKAGAGSAQRRRKRSQRRGKR